MNANWESVVQSRQSSINLDVFMSIRRYEIWCWVYDNKELFCSSWFTTNGFALHPCNVRPFKVLTCTCHVISWLLSLLLFMLELGIIVIIRCYNVFFRIWRVCQSGCDAWRLSTRVLWKIHHRRRGGFKRSDIHIFVWSWWEKLYVSISNITFDVFCYVIYYNLCTAL